MAQAVQPLVKETGLPEFPFTIGGTVFLVGLGGRVFVVSSRHALNPDQLNPLWIFVHDGSRKRIPLASVHFAPVHLLPDDYADIALIEVDQASALRQYARHSTILDLDRHMIDWKLYRYTSPLSVVGFANELSHVDYDKQEIRNQRVSLRGRYLAPAMGPHLHTIEIDTPPSLSTLSGISGGPVLAYVHRLGVKPQLVLCGVAIQGTTESRMVHFIELELLVTAIQVWCER